MPGAISVNPASRTTGSPRPSVRATASWAAVRTDSGNPASRQAFRSVSDSSHQASWAPCPACAIALPADISRSGFSHSTGARSVRRRRGLRVVQVRTGDLELRQVLRPAVQRHRREDPYLGAISPVTVMPGSASARRHSAPRARRTTLRIRASCQSRMACAHSPSPSERSSASIASTARAAVSSASVRAGGSGLLDPDDQRQHELRRLVPGGRAPCGNRVRLRGGSRVFVRNNVRVTGHGASLPARRNLPPVRNSWRNDCVRVRMPAMKSDLFATRAPRPAGHRPRDEPAERQVDQVRRQR